MVDLADGETTEMQGSAAKPYEIKNVGGVYSCTCPAWRNQSLAIDQRTCKHIRKLRGDQAESDRIGRAVTTRPPRKDGQPPKEGPPLLLAQAWDNATDLTDWWMSEKLDGVRAYWDGRQFLSRGGNVYHAPDWFIDGLGEVPLDGELWLDRKQFQKTVSIVRRQDKSEHWKQIRYVVFDAPQADGNFETRQALLADCLAAASLPHVTPLEQHPCTGLDHMREELARIEGLGGEGLMLRQPHSAYEVGRSWTLLKVKTFRDGEAVVVGHQGGKGRHKGRLGALQVQLPDGTAFSVGTGLSDAQRADPPPIGSVVAFRYQELSDARVPRFPSFVGVREDSDLTVGPELAATVADAQADQAERQGDAAKGKASVSAAPESAPADGTEPRYFELVDDKSSKFWEISTDGCDVTVRYGRIGANGQTKTKTFADGLAAKTHYDKLVDQKTGKGYQETDRS